MVLGFGRSSHSHIWTPGSYPAGTPMLYPSAAPVYPAAASPYYYPAMYSPQPAVVPVPVSPMVVPVSTPHVHAATMAPVAVLQQQPQPPPATTYTVMQRSPAPASAPPLPPAEHHHHYYHVPSPVISHAIPPAASPRPSRPPPQITQEFDDSKQGGYDYGHHPNFVAGNGGGWDNNALSLQIHPPAARGQQQQQAQASPHTVNVNLNMVMQTPQQQPQQLLAVPDTNSSPFRPPLSQPGTPHPHPMTTTTAPAHTTHHLPPNGLQSVLTLVGQLSDVRDFLQLQIHGPPDHPVGPPQPTQFTAQLAPCEP
ncbi:hypothetical protein BJV74DRAFT_191264 [Russula compacta]|nr:hypothetical protein BJV74DRAFT_191264 [Russula compacta]